jgi:hypothetical protein
LDRQRAVDKCKFSDYDGRILSEGDYSTCDGRPPLPDEKLRLDRSGASAAVIRLQDGTLLFEASNCSTKGEARP